MADLESQLLTTDPEVLGLQRQRQLADLLTSQAFNQPQGQMISGRYVAPSALQQALPMIQAAIGGLTNANLDTKQQALAEALRGKQKQNVREYYNALNPKQSELAGPTPTGEALTTVNTPDYQKALEIATDPYSPKWLQQLAVDELKTQKYGEGEVGVRRNPVTGQIETVGKGKDKYHPLQTIDMGTRGTLVIDPNTGKREIIQKGIERAGTVYESPSGPMLVDTRSGTARPITVNGQPLQSNKPLPEGATGQVTGIENVKSALRDLRTNLKDFTTFDMAKPNARALMNTEYQNVVLQLKEAMKLGVLNGNDYAILTSMITDPNSASALLLDKDTQLKQIDNLEKKLEDMTSNVYKTHGRSVPKDLGISSPSSNMPKLRYNLQTGQWE